MLRQEREEKAALQREYDRMRAGFETRDIEGKPKLETRDIEREAREKIQKGFHSYLQEKKRKFF